MKLVEYDYKKLRIYSNNTKILTDFQKSELKCAKLEDWSWANAGVGARALNGSCKNLKLYHIKAIVRCGEIYLVNEAITEG